MNFLCLLSVDHSLYSIRAENCILLDNVVLVVYQKVIFVVFMGIKLSYGQL